MRAWKVILGLGTACAACCAVPVLSVAGGLAASVPAFWVCTDELVPEGIAMGAIIAALVGLWFFRAQRAARSSACGCAQSSSAGVEHVQT
jgi:hypothetical protein